MSSDGGANIEMTGATSASKSSSANLPANFGGRIPSRMRRSEAGRVEAVLALLPKEKSRLIHTVGVAVDRLLFGRAEAWVRERWGLAAA